MKEQLVSVEQRIISFICEDLGIDIEDIDLDMNLGAYGLGSIAANNLIGILENMFVLKLSPLLVFEYTTISSLSRAIEELIEEKSLSKEP